MKIAFRLVMGAIDLLLLFVVGGLLAHIGIRQGNSAIPEVDEVLALASEAERPIRLFDIKTSTQRGSDGSVVLHPIFVLE